MVEEPNGKQVGAPQNAARPASLKLRKTLAERLYSAHQQKNDKDQQH